MVTVDKYIRKLIFEHDCVIIPEFGGLLTHHIAAQYDSSNGVMVPSRKRLAFNEVLNVDDGLLIYFISINEKISREEALQGVRKYVETLRSRMQPGQSAVIDNIGSFATNAEGKIVFEPQHNQNFNSDWYGFKAFSLKQQSDSHFISGEESELATASTAKTLLFDEILSVEASEEVNEPAPIMQWYKWVAAAMLAAVVFAASMSYKTTETTSMLSTLNPITGIHDVLVNLSLLSSPEKNQVKVVDFNEALIKPALNEAVATDSVVVDLEVSPQVIVAEPAKAVAAEVSPKANKQPKDIVAPTLVKREKTETLVQSNKLYLIAGSFGKKKNALNLQKRLMKEGFSDAMIMEGDDSKLIKVSAGTYSTMEQATEKKYKVDSISRADSWVYQKK